VNITAREKETLAARVVERHCSPRRLLVGEEGAGHPVELAFGRSVVPPLTTANSPLAVLFATHSPRRTERWLRGPGPRRPRRLR
jgi:hypothetical protein